MEKKEKHQKEEKKDLKEEYLKIECRMYENKFPKKDDLVMVRKLSYFIFPNILLLVPYR